MADKQSFTVGIDLGGTKIKAAVIDGDGRVVTSHKCPTGADRPADMVVRDIVASAQVCMDEAGVLVEALGIGIAGQVDTETGILHSSPNLYWDAFPFPLQQKLEEGLDLPVIITNDVRAILWGEWKHGAGQGVEDMIVVFVGTGIGGSILSGGRVIIGDQGSAGELGHTMLVAGGRPCHCPGVGCFEAYAGGWAIAERAQEAVRADEAAGALLINLAGSIDQITAETLDKAFEQGDALAKRLVEETGFYLGAGLTGLINALNPRCLVLGGGVIDGVPELVEMAEAVIRKHAMEVARQHLKVVRAALGSDAGVIGAATLARQLLEQKAVA
jgi:glucokinase